VTPDAGPEGRRTSRPAAWLALLAVSSALHLVDLGARSYHHDESIHAHAAWVLAHEGRYRYDPTYHGPLLYLLSAGTLRLAGDGAASDAAARLPVAAAGIALVGVAWSLRRRLGERAALWTGWLAALSPITLYYGRFLRMDVLELATASAAAAGAWHAATGRPRLWPWAGVAAGLALATKENAYVTVALVAAVAVLLVVAGRRPLLRIRATWGWILTRRWGLAAAAASAVATAVALYTLGLTHPEDWRFPIRAVSYWWGQHEVQRIPGPWHFHLTRLAFYEWLPIGAALLWAARRRRRMGLAERALLLFGLGSLAMYAYLGEKVPWLAVHQVWGFLPLAGMQLAHVFGPDGRRWAKGAAAVAVAASAASAVVASFVLEEITPDRRRAEALTYVQTCPEMVDLVREVRGRGTGDGVVAAVSGGAAWPLAWYWRDLPVRWSPPEPGTRPPVVVCDPDEADGIRRVLGPGYDMTTAPLRAWWLWDGTRPSLADLARYAVARVPWSPVGASEVRVLRRTPGDRPLGAREVAVPLGLRVLGAERARLVGEGLLTAPYGVDLAPDGRLAVADPGASRVVVLDEAGAPVPVPAMPLLEQPEDVAWVGDGLLAVADTWNHRALLVGLGPTGGVRELPAPAGGWYGPRSVTVAPDRAIAVSDTGNRRVALLTVDRGREAVELLGAGLGLLEPVGVAWLDADLLVCDSGNRRLLTVSRGGRTIAEARLDRAWSEPYSRPQVAVLPGGGRLVTDPPAGRLWLLGDGGARPLELAGDGIVPTGVAASGGTVAVADRGGRVWLLEGVTAATGAGGAEGPP